MLRILRSISQCADNARRQKAAIQLQNDRPPTDPPFPSNALSTCLPDLESHPGADPSLTSPLTVVPRDLQSAAPATMSMHLYRPVYAPLYAFVAPTLHLHGERTRAEKRIGSPGVIEPQQ